MSITVAEIEDKIGVARERLATLDREAQSFAMPAVAGDQDAATSLARVNAQSSQVVSDLAVLERARLTAVEQRRQAVRDDVATYRARHLEIARDRASAIVKLAARIDALAAECKSAFAEMKEIESEIWEASIEASRFRSALSSMSKQEPEYKIWEELRGPLPSYYDAAVGRRGLVTFATDSLIAFTSGTDQLREPLSVADVAAKAWAFLLSKEADSDDI